MKNIKQPLSIALVVAGAMTIIGALIGWFGIENELVKSLAENELAKKENLAIVLSLVSVVTLVLAAARQKHRVVFLVTVLSMYELIMIINQKPEDAVARQIGVTVELGYWLSIIGTLAVILVSGIIGAKGFDITTKK